MSVRAIAAVFLLAISTGGAYGAESDLAGMLSEAAELSKERTGLATRVQDNLRVARELESDQQRLQQDGVRLEARVAALAAEKPAITALCTGSVPQSQWAAAQARCDAVADPYNARVEAHNTEYRAAMDRMNALLKRVEANRNEARELAARERQIETRMSVLRSLMSNAGACTAGCASGSAEQAAQCLQVCFDGARRQTATVEQNQRPPMVITPASDGAVRVPTVTRQRTPEEAIREYRESGSANPMPNTFRRTAPPPPPPAVR